MSQEGSHDLVERYLAEISSAPRVDRNEEAVLLQQARSGDDRARKRLIESYLNETANLALDACPPSLDRLDAIQEANVALVRLIETTEEDDLAAALPEAVRSAIRRALDPPVPIGIRVRYRGPDMVASEIPEGMLRPGAVGTVLGFIEHELVIVDWDEVVSIPVPVEHLEQIT